MKVIEILLTNYNLEEANIIIAQHLIASNPKMTKQKVATELGLSLKTVFRWSKNGKI